MLWEAPMWVCFPHTVGATLLPAHPVGCSVVYRAPGTEDSYRHDHPHLTILAQVIQLTHLICLSK